jgi:hypothetical protein
MMDNNRSVWYIRSVIIGPKENHITNDGSIWVQNVFWPYMYSINSVVDERYYICLFFISICATSWYIYDRYRLYNNESSFTVSITLSKSTSTLFKCLMAVVRAFSCLFKFPSEFPNIVKCSSNLNDFKHFYLFISNNSCFHSACNYKKNWFTVFNNSLVFIF